VEIARAVNRVRGPSRSGREQVVSEFARRIVVVGTGYVGLTTDACLASLGHRVVCADVDEAKVERLRAGQINIREPGLAKRVAETMAAGLTDWASAEMIKYAANCFLAMKLSYVNAIAELCERLDADVADVIEGLGFDKRIGQAFLSPGPGWGGSCLPKDTSALLQLSASVDFEFRLLRATIETNTRQSQQMVEKIRLAVYGPRQRPDMAFTRFCRAVAEGEQIQVFGSGDQVRDFTYVDDVVEANIRASMAPVGNGAVFNVAGGTSTTVNEVLDLLGEIPGREVRVARAPPCWVTCCARGSTDAILAVTGWTPAVPVCQGLEEQYRWATTGCVAGAGPHAAVGGRAGPFRAHHRRQRIRRCRPTS
jgi:nucleoside-diphosphate-sugar epimerase